MPTRLVGEPCKPMTGGWFYAMFTALGIVGGVVAVRVAGRRNQAQPIESCVEDEDDVLEALEADPAQIVRAWTEMTVADYSNERRRARYQMVLDTVSAHVDDELRQRIVEANRTQDADALRTLATQLRAHCGGAELDNDEVERFLRAGSNVISCAAGRTQNTERSALVETGDDRRPYRRVESRVRATRQVAAGGCAGVFGLVGTIAVAQRWDGPGMWAGAIAILVVVVGGVLVAAVDLDTFYLDTPVFWAWATTSWTLAALAAWIDGDVSSVTIGAIGALGVAVGFELVARLWSKLRGITQGAGDTWIAIVTAGVPTGITGDWRVAVWSVLFAAIGAALHWSTLAVVRGATRETPVPFGPWLVAGGFAAMLAWVVGA